MTCKVARNHAHGRPIAAMELSTNLVPQKSPLGPAAWSAALAARLGIVQMFILIMCFFHQVRVGRTQNAPNVDHTQLYRSVSGLMDSATAKRKSPVQMSPCLCVSLSLCLSVFPPSWFGSSGDAPYGLWLGALSKNNYEIK